MIENKETFLVDFYADWCGPCKLLGKYFKEREKELKNKVLKINVDNGVP